MGIDFYTCELCGDTFPDCGEYGTCAKCENDICINCYNEQNIKYGTVDKDSKEAKYFGDKALKECNSCSEKIVHDSDIFEYLLKITKMTKDEIVKAVKKEKGITD